MKRKWAVLTLSALLATSVVTASAVTVYGSDVEEAVVIAEDSEEIAIITEDAAENETSSEAEAGDADLQSEDEASDTLVIEEITEIDEANVPSAVSVEEDEAAIISEEADSAAGGLGVASHTVEEIVSFLKNNGVGINELVTYEEEPVLTAPYSVGSLSEDSKADALAMLNNVRYIAGLSADLTWDTAHEEMVQAGTLVNAVNGSLTHYPTQPSDMSDDLYSLAYSGCSSSNIASGYSSLTKAIVTGWMADSSSESNLQAVGHRRWILNPYMGKTAFGKTGKYSAMYAFDSSNSSAAETAVAWPAQVMPLEYFASTTPWSVSSISVTDSSAVTVTMTRESDGTVWTFSEENSNDGYFYASEDNGYIVFRPSSISYSDGDVFDVTITGLEETISYTVTFFELDQYWHTHNYSIGTISWAPDYLSADITYTCTCGETYTKTHTAAIYPEDGLCTTSENIIYTVTTDTGATTSKSVSAHKYTAGTVTDGVTTITCSVCGGTKEVGVVTAYGMWWRNTTSSSTSYRNSYSSNYTIGDQVQYWAEATAGGNDTITSYDTNYVVESSDDSIVSVTQNALNKYGTLTMMGPGTATITVYPTYNPDLSKSYTFHVNDISYYTTTLSATSCTYTGAAQTLAVTVNDGTSDLTEETDFTVSYSNNIDVGTATVTVTGKGNYTGTVTKTFRINQADISSSTVAVSDTNFTYDGDAKTPDVTVKTGNTTLIEDGDYAVAYLDNTNAGTAKVMITGKGNYTGSLEAAFTINKADQTITVSPEAPSVEAGKTVSLTVSAAGTITYEISDSSVATVSSGVITGINKGNATLTIAAAGDNNYNAARITVNITVTEAAASPDDSSDDSSGSGTAGSGTTGGDSGSTSGSGTAGSGSTGGDSGSTTGSGTTGSDSGSTTGSGTTGSDSGNTSGSGTTGSDSGSTTGSSTTGSGSSNASGSNTGTTQLAAGKISSLTNTSQGITIKWDAVTGASGYYISRRTASGSYQVIATIASGATVSYTDKNVKSKNGTLYTYKVVPYSGNLTGSFTETSIVRLTGTKLSSVKNTSSKKATVKWKKTTKVTGYQIQYSTSKTFKSGNKTVKVSGAKKVSKVLSKLKKGKTYYVRVRTYKKINGKTYYSAWSSKKKVKISK